MKDINLDSFVTQSSWSEECSPVEDVMRNKIILAVILTLISGLTFLFVLCTCVFCRYRKMKNQYYERLSLIKNRDPGRFTDQDSNV